MIYPAKPDFRPPNLATRVAMFGKFNYKPIGNGNIKILGSWTAQNIVKLRIPQLAGIEGCNPTGTIYFHKLGVEQLEGFFDEVEARRLKSRILTWAGSFVPRFVRGSSTDLSNHAWATAFDINAAWNGLGRTPAASGKSGSVVELVSIANDFGFYWGGHFSRPDGMHFELAVLKKFPKSYSFLSNAEVYPQNVAQVIDSNKLEPVLTSDVHSVNQAVTLPDLQTPIHHSADSSQTNLSEAPKEPVQETTPVIVNAPAKEGSTSTAVKTTILGVTVPAFVGVAVKSISDLISQGYVSSQQIGEFVLNLVKENQKYVMLLIALIIGLLTIKKLCKQITLWIQMKFAASKDKNSIEVMPQ